MSTALNLPDDEDLWGPFREEIARRLNRDRPSRYSQADQSWMEPTIAWARGHLPADDVEVVRRVGRTEVVAVEKNANRLANTKLKRAALGTGSLFWADLGPLPFTVDKRNGSRIRFDAATPEDFEQQGFRIKADAKQRYETEVVVGDYMITLGQRARAAGYERVSLIGDLPLRDDGRLAELDWDDEDDDED